MLKRKRKLAILAWAVARNSFSYSVPFIRFIPTDRCNLDCRYYFFRNMPAAVMRYPVAHPRRVAAAS